MNYDDWKSDIGPWPGGSDEEEEEPEMGYVMATSECYGCKQIFSYNPVRVPSILVNGSREPICRDCVERVNPQRVAKGLEPIVPLPGAYDACPEEELP